MKGHFSLELIVRARVRMAYHDARLVTFGIIMFASTGDGHHKLPTLDAFETFILETPTA